MVAAKLNQMKNQQNQSNQRNYCNQAESKVLLENQNQTTMEAPQKTMNALTYRHL